jgi:hypothetical protein
MPAISESAPTAHTPERRKGGGGKGSGGGGKGGGGSGGGGGKSGGGGGGSSSSGGKQDYGGSLASAHPSRIQGPARQRPSRAATRRRGRRKPSDSARALALVRACMHHRTALAAAGSTPLGPVHPTRAMQDSIYGTSRYSSGYPYGYSGYYMDSWAFPYVFWPVPIHSHYYCASQCVSVLHPISCTRDN